jgi:hypothetical protein
MEKLETRLCSYCGLSVRPLQRLSSAPVCVASVAIQRSSAVPMWKHMGSWSVAKEMNDRSSSFRALPFHR